MTQPDAIEELTRALRTDIDAVHAQVVAEIAGVATVLYTQPVAVRVARLRALEQTLLALADQVDAIAARYVTAAIQTAYEIGAWATAVTTGTSATFAPLDVDAITHIAGDTMDSLLHATQGMREDVKVLIRETVRDRVRAKVFTGQTALQAGRDLAVELAERGVTAVTYADGRRVSLPTYAEMVVRTKTAEAYQEGGMNQGERLGVEWWEVMDGPECILPGSRFLPYGDLTQIVRAQFSGPAFRVTARTPAGPRTLTVGPNHPVLTARGWVRAHLLTERDQLVYDLRGEDPATLAELHLEQVPVVEDVFAAAGQRRPLSVRPSTGDDLHGDAVFCEREVDVVVVERGLLVVDDASCVEQGGEGDLVLSDAGSALVPCDGAGADRGVGLNVPPAGFIGGRGPGSPFLGPCPLVPAGERLTAAEGHAALVERGVDLFGSQPELGSDLSGRQPRLVEPLDLGVRQAGRRGVHAGVGAEPPLAVVAGVELGLAGLADGGAAGSAVALAHGLLLCQVEAVELGGYHGAVFDATTTTGVYMADGFVVKNCGWSSHDDPQHADGMIVPLATAREHPTSHPNCRRSTSPRPDITSAREARDASPTPSGDAARDQEVAVAQQARAQRLVAVSTGAPARASAGLDLQAGTVPPSAAALRHAAMLRRRA